MFFIQLKWKGNFVEDHFQERKQNHSFWFWYQLSNEQAIVNTEYLIYDFNSMIGSIGGTLGLFIGFSFSNIISYAISQLRKFLNHYILSRNYIRFLKVVGQLVTRIFNFFKIGAPYLVNSQKHQGHCPSCPTPNVVPEFIQVKK